MLEMDGDRYIELVGKYFPALTLYARKWTGENAEDIVQDVFLKMLKSFRNRELPENPAKWLFQAVRTTAIDHWRKRVARERFTEQFSLSVSQAFEDNSDNRLDAEEMTRRLDNLSDENRQIVVMHLWACLSFEEIAEAVGSSKTTVFRKYEQSLDLLRGEQHHDD